MSNHLIMSPLNYLSTFKAKFLGMSSFMNVELYHWYISFKIFNKTVYNEINREKYFCKEGVLLDEFLHILYESKVYYEKFFILLFVSQRHFEWCKVQHNETIYFLYWDLKFFLFLKKYYKLRQNFFLGQRMIFYFWLWRYEIFLRRCA